MPSKTTEDSSLATKARRAVELIAEARDSATLRSWLETGNLGEASMDIGEAYRQLAIQDRTIDETLIESAYKMALEDNPQQSEMYARAFNAIMADRKSPKFQSTSQPAQARPALGRPDWPVGLENIGNTCYLNSLLQFLFTVPELRQLVLNFEEVRMELTPENLARKRVGSRHIALREIEHAQRCKLEAIDMVATMQDRC